MFALLVLLLAALVAYWHLRPNRSAVDPRLELETWSAVADRKSVV
jgi:hypothetical protein